MIKVTQESMDKICEWFGKNLTIYHFICDDRWCRTVYFSPYLWATCPSCSYPVEPIGEVTPRHLKVVDFEALRKERNEKRKKRQQAKKEAS